MKGEVGLARDVNLENIKKLTEFKERNKSDTEMAFYNDNIKGKTSEEIAEVFNEKIGIEKIVDFLLFNETGDDGGIIAISGFYFQFLVTIEYLIELIDGKWDFILVDHHQDIIIINAKQIRIIQVKTKNVTYCDVSDTKLYTEWIQKLFQMDEKVKDFEVRSEFELVTNFLIKNSPKVEMEVYHHNSKYNMQITKNLFFSKIKHFSQQNNYGSLTNEDYLEELLSKFKITIKNPQNYFDQVCSRLGELFYKRFKSPKEDIDFLIGYICSMCNYPPNPSFQLIDKQKGMQIKEVLRNRYQEEVRKHMEEEDSIYTISRYIDNLRSTFFGMPIFGEIEPHIQSFEQDLIDTVNEGNSIHSILSRFVDRVYLSTKFDVYSKTTTYEKVIEELLDLTFFLKLSTGGRLTIDPNHSKLLIKVIGNKKFNLFNLNGMDDYEKGIARFKEVFKTCNFIEKNLLLTNGNLKIILAGDFDDYSFPEIPHIELEFPDTPTEEDMKAIAIDLKKDSITKVTYKVNVLNGSYNVTSDLRRNKRMSNFLDYEEFIKGKMG